MPLIPDVVFEAKKEVHMELLVSGVLPNCLYCEAFTEDMKFCTHWRANPPMETLVYGCTMFIEMMPF